MSRRRFAVGGDDLAAGGQGAGAFQDLVDLGEIVVLHRALRLGLGRTVDGTPMPTLSLPASTVRSS